MALIKCPECGKEVSEYSETCIGCGFPISQYITQQKMEEEILSIDISHECNAIKDLLSNFKNTYVPLTGMRIDISSVKQITNELNQKIQLLSIESKKKLKGQFAENFCIGLCENNNASVLNFADVKYMCDIIKIDETTENNINNMTKTIYSYIDSITGSSGLMAFSWLIYELLDHGSENDIILLESTLSKPNSFGKPRKSDIMEIVNKLKNESTHTVSSTKTDPVKEYIPKCPTCGSTDIQKVSTVSKAGSVFLWGLLSQKVKKQWHCNNCGSEW